MNINKKFILRVKSLLILVTTCSVLLTFGANNSFSQVKSEEDIILKNVPILQLESEYPKKVQVKYQVKYLDENGETVDFTRTKIAFSGDTVTEKATNLKGYQLISENQKTVVLNEENNEPIVFLYSKIDLEKLNELKLSIIEQIDKLPKVKLIEKIEYKENVDKALTEKEVNDLFKAIKKIDEETKVILNYKIRYVDEEGNDIARTITKIGFSDDVVTEEAIEIEEYIKQEEKKTLTLSPSQDNSIVFIYSEKVDELKTAIIQKIENLKRVSPEQKKAYKEEVSKARTKKEINNLFETIKKN